MALCLVKAQGTTLPLPFTQEKHGKPQSGQPRYCSLRRLGRLVGVASTGPLYIRPLRLTMRDFRQPLVVGGMGENSTDIDTDWKGRQVPLASRKRGESDPAASATVMSPVQDSVSVPSSSIPIKSTLRRRQRGPLKRRYPITTLHSVEIQKTST
jgi:hypothetical protein